MKNKKGLEMIGIILIILFLILMGFIIYIEFFVCGGSKGTMADIPRYCWFFR